MQPRALKTNTRLSHLCMLTFLTSIAATGAVFFVVPLVFLRVAGSAIATKTVLLYAMHMAFGGAVCTVICATIEASKAR